MLFYCTGGRLAVALSGVLVLSLLLALLFWLGKHDDWSEWVQWLSDLLPAAPLLTFAFLLREIQKLLATHSLTDLQKQDSSSSLVYLHSDRPELVARGEELEKLRDFCSPVNTIPGADDKLKIIFLVAPGGYGKSRLADEFCREHLPPGWRAGLVSEVEASKPYFLTQPSVVIFDYGDLQVSKLAASLQQLEESQQLSGVPLRLIALARSFSVGNLAYQALQQELQDKYNKPSGWLDEHCHQPLCLPLPTLTATNNQELLKKILSKRGADDAQKQWAIRQLAALQEQRKDSTFPLALYMLAAVALRQDTNFNSATLDWQQLLQSCLDHEQQQWWTIDTNSTEREAIKTWAFALAVAAGPYPLSLENTNKLKEYLNPVLESLGTQDFDHRQGMKHYRAAQGGMCSLQPDLLAEYFAAQFYAAAQNPEANLELKPKYQQLLKYLLRNFPEASFSFSLRLMQDIPTSALSQSLVSRLEDNPLVVALIADHARTQGDLTAAELGLQRLDKLGSHGTRFAAMIRVNLIYAYGRAQNLNRAEDLYQQLRDLRSKNPKSDEIALRQAEALMNLISGYGKTQNFKRTESLYQQLEELRNSLPENKAIARADIELGINLISAYGNARKLERAKKVHRQTQKVIANNLEKVEAELYKSKAMANLINVYCNAQKLLYAEVLYRRLQKLCAKWLENEEIAAAQAMSITNLINSYGMLQNLDRAEALHQQLQKLCYDHPNSDDIALEEAKSLLNLITYHSQTKNSKRAEALYQKLAMLRLRVVMPAQHNNLESRGIEIV